MRQAYPSLLFVIREHFTKIVKETLDALPEEFRSRIRNVAVLVEDLPRNQPPHPKRLLLGVFHGVPRTNKSVFDLPTGPDYIVLYQKNIEAVCSNEEEVREQIRLTVIHELGHYFGMSEDQLRDV
jgi:predicted Zn-dependent protease with MMP-like domain